MGVALESVRMMEAGVAVACAYVSIFLHMLSLYAKQKPLGCKNRRGQSETAVI